MSNQSSNLPSIVGNVPEALLNLVTRGDFKDTSLETMKHHRVLNRMAIVQGQSQREVKAKFGEGAVIIPVAELKLGDKDVEFDAVPVMFFDEFITWNDRNDKTSPKIRDKSLDRASVIAQKSADPNLRQEAYGEEASKFKMRHTHHLTFLVVIYSGPYKGTLCAMSFSRGEFRKGMAFINAIKMRRINGTQAPLWATNWRFSVGERKNEKGEWYGFDFENADSPWIAGEDMAQMQTLHSELLKDYKEQAIVVGHEAADLAGDEEAGDLASSTDM